MCPPQATPHEMAQISLKSNIKTFFTSLSQSIAICNVNIVYERIPLVSVLHDNTAIYTEGAQSRFEMSNSFASLTLNRFAPVVAIRQARFFRIFLVSFVIKTHDLKLATTNK